MFSRVKGNGHFILRAYLFQLAAAFFGLIITFTTSGLSSKDSDRFLDNLPFFIGSLLCVGFFLYLEYNLYWELGSKDRLKIDGGRLDENKLAPLGLSLITNAPSIILGILIFITSFTRETVVVDGVSIANTAENIYTVSRTIASVWQSMYWGIYFVCHYASFVYLVFVLPVIVFEWLGYNYGVKNFSIAEKLGFSKKKK